VLAVPSGSIVTFDTLSQEGLLEDQGGDPVRFFARFGISAADVPEEAIALAAAALPHDVNLDGPHLILGPVRVEGAGPGDVLKVEVLCLEPRSSYGIISQRHGRGVLAGEFPEVSGPGRDAACPGQYEALSFCASVGKREGRWYGFMMDGGREIHFPLHPFLGLMGVTPDTEDSWNSVPPARIGGNMDIPELGAGSTLYLPVEVEGAGFYAGDPHLRQGCGEVALTALEGSLRATLRLTAIPQGSIAVPRLGGKTFAFPFAETERHWIPIGLHEDLDEALKMSVRASVAFLSAQLGLDRGRAYAYLSAAVDYIVSQAVDRTKGIHALVPKADFLDCVRPELEIGKEFLPVETRNGAFFVPARRVCAALGLRCSWNKGLFRTESPAGMILMRADSRRCDIGRERVSLDMAPGEGGEGLMLPAAALRSIFGLCVNWSTEGRRIVGRACLLPPSDRPRPRRPQLS
jgi:acetamidase/formamidase